MAEISAQHVAVGPTNTYIGDIPPSYWPAWHPYAVPYRQSCPHINCPICNPAGSYKCTTCGGTYSGGHYCPGPNKIAKGWTSSSPNKLESTLPCTDVKLRE